MASGPAQSISTAIKTKSSVATATRVRRGTPLGVVFVNASCALVNGYGSRELIIEIKGRPPVWSNAGRAWVAQPSTAHDVIALAERRGYDVTITQDDPFPAARGLLW